MQRSKMQQAGVGGTCLGLMEELVMGCTAQDSLMLEVGSS